MKNFYAVTFLLLIFFTGNAQVALPYTLNFTTDDPTDWSDGYAQDGDGGTSNINDIDIQIYATDASFVKLSGSTMTWKDSEWLATNDGFHGVTPGPDVTVTNNGIPAMMIKSTSTANNFSLDAITLYDWGGVGNITIDTYDNGIFVGSVTVSLNFTTGKSFSQSGELTPSKFNNIDEARFYPQGATEFWLSMNSIAFNAPAATLPVNLDYLKASLQTDQSVLLQWQTNGEQNSREFIIEHSVNGADWNTAGQVAAAGTTTAIRNYRFIHHQPGPDKNFYRLKQVDADNRFTYSDVKTVFTGPGETIVIIKGNPVSNYILSLDIRQPAVVSIYSNTGNLVFRKQLQTGVQTIPVSNWAKGRYFLRTEKESISFLIQ